MESVFSCNTAKKGQVTSDSLDLTLQAQGHLPDLPEPFPSCGDFSYNPANRKMLPSNTSAKACLVWRFEPLC